MILFSNSASFTLSLFTMFDADCDSERLCLFTWVRLREESVGVGSSLFLRLSSLRLWKCVRALTSACSAVFCSLNILDFFLESTTGRNIRLSRVLQWFRTCPIVQMSFQFGDRIFCFGNFCLLWLMVDIFSFNPSIFWLLLVWRVVLVGVTSWWSGLRWWRWIFVSIILFFGVRWRTVRRCSWCCVIDIPITRCIWPEI